MVWHAFRFKHLINQAVVQFHGEDELTDSTANIQQKNKDKEFQHHLLKTYFQTLDLVFHGMAWHAFPFKHLINQAIVQFHGEDEFTDSTANIQQKNKEFQHHLLKTYFQTLDLVFYGMAFLSG